jgi:large subunit ribosomal protein L9
MSQVKLILTEGVHNLGESGDLVSVRPGYARNYLLPQGKAILATDSRVKELEHNRRIVAEKAAKELKDLHGAKKRLEALKLETSARAGDEGKLFGSITTANVAELLAAQGFEIDRRRISLDSIKSIGDHKVEVKLHRDVTAEIKLHVKPEGAAPSEAEEAFIDPDDRPAPEDALEAAAAREDDEEE